MFSRAEDELIATSDEPDHDRVVRASSSEWFLEAIRGNVDVGSNTSKTCIESLRDRYWLRTSRSGPDA